MTFRRSAPVTLCLSVIVLVTAMAAVAAMLFTRLTTAVEENQFQLMRAIVETALANASNKALATAELIASLPPTQPLMAGGDRKALLAEFAPMFAIQKARHGVDQAQFHVPPATSVLRLHEPSAFGDDGTASKPMVVAANRDKAPIKGIASARNGPAIFGVAPITDANGRHLGSFEVGIAFGPLLADLKVAYGIDLALFVDGELLREFGKNIAPERLGEDNRVGHYIRLETTNAATMAALVEPSDLAVVTEPVTYTRDADGLVQGVVLIPLTNALGAPLGVIAAARDFGDSRAAWGRSMVWLATMALVVMVLLCGIILIVVRGFVVRPLQVLGEGLVSLANGGPLDPIEGSERFAGELQPFVELYDRVRLRRARAGAPS
ncbi:cache domain-containing protein [Aquabacter sp. CN5-332]|uniref:cache domain-containing protein n=1 Tax=Aquabacter sp. CN5-332 TaxID=3156608 RepID=UPI0032B4E5B8